jgi:hypothetical protein
MLNQTRNAYTTSMNELTIGDKTYISSKRAAEVTGYAKDYVGQLCREGHVEAKMVGRSWYVLEESIRRHRFGDSVPEEVTVATTEEEMADSKLPDTWEAPRYSSEPVAQIPKIAPQAPKYSSATASSLRTPEFAAPDTSDRTISDMQAAWREWFESKNTDSISVAEETAREEVPEPVIEAPKPVLEPEEAISVPLHKIPEPKREVSQHAGAMDVLPKAVIREETIRITPRKPQKQRSSLVTVAVLIVIAGLSVVVGAVGAGFADSYVADNAIFQFIGGTRTINK